MIDVAWTQHAQHIVAKSIQVVQSLCHQSPGPSSLHETSQWQHCRFLLILDTMSNSIKKYFTALPAKGDGRAAPSQAASGRSMQQPHVTQKRLTPGKRKATEVSSPLCLCAHLSICCLLCF
jgi:hypothetical protein